MCPVRVMVPELGESVVEATVGAWSKAAGDEVARDEPIGELETDKITQEVTAFRAGTLAAILVAQGETVPIGTTIAVIAKEGESLTEDEARAWAAAGKPEAAAPAPPPAPPREAPEAPEASEAPAPEPVVSPPPAPAPATAPTPAAAAGGRVRTSPAVRQAARERGIDLATVAPSGPGGRVVMADLDAAAAAPPAAAPTPAAAPLPPPGEGEVVERVAMSRSTSVMSRHMVASKQTSPHFTIVDEVDMGETLAVHKRLRAAYGESGVRLTLQAFFVRAAVAALREHPRVNASLEGEEILLRRYYHIGMAASVGEDLVVPVVRHADRLDLQGLAARIGALSASAREGRLTMADITGGTFTITNAGMFGGPLMSAPIINQPQVAILGVHNIQERPVARAGAVVVRPMLYLSLSSDHRLVDGVLAIRFLNRVKELLAHPGLLATGPLA